MRTFLLAPLAVALLLGIPTLTRADDDVRALIEKAIKAVGGEETLSQRGAVSKKINGVIHPIGGAKFSGELFAQGVGKQRAVFHFDLDGNRMNIISVYNEGKAWVNINGETQTLDGQHLKETEQETHAVRVSGLLTLLKDKAYTLTALGESKVEDRAVAGVKVSAKDKPDVFLYFEKTSGLLAKVEYTLPGDGTVDGKPPVVAVILSEYREPDLTGADERTLKAATVGTDGPALLDFLRKQTLAVDDQDKIKALVKQLGDDSFQAREDASARLVALGSKARPFLLPAAKSTDPEVSRRAQQCLQQIEEGKGTAAVAAALRLLSQRRPDGAAEVLLAYLSCAPDEGLVREVRAALAAVALRDGKPDKALEKALQDKDPLRRAAAEAALGKDGGAYAKQPGRRLYPQGLKVPMKAIHYRDGEKYIEQEVTEVIFYNLLDDGLFVKP